MTIKSFIPPVLLELKRLAQPAAKIYPNYEDALAQCNAGYHSDDLTQVIVKKTERYRDSLVADRVVIPQLHTSVLTAIGLSAAGGNLNCIDFGGAAGAHFFLAKKLFNNVLNLNWHVVETKSMVTAAAKLAGDGLRFFSDIDEAAASFDPGRKQIDLVFTSGALQYVPDPKTTLTKLTSLNARTIFITRLGLSDNPSVNVTIQKSLLSSNGHGPLPSGYTDREITYPITFCTRNEIEQTLVENYDIKGIFLEQERYDGALNGKSVPMYSFFARAKNTMRDKS